MEQTVQPALRCCSTAMHTQTVYVGLQLCVSSIHQVCLAYLYDVRYSVRSCALVCCSSPSHLQQAARTQYIHIQRAVRTSRIRVGTKQQAQFEHSTSGSVLRPFATADAQRTQKATAPNVTVQKF
jgi:hypothetical protein